jgi:hypothetical protein
MSTTFTWTIKNITCITELGGRQNVVSQIDWVCRARADVDGKVFMQETPGTSSFGQFDPNAPFVEFNDLTEDQTYERMAVEGLNKPAVEERLQMLLDEQINPRVLVYSPPWLVARI